MLVTPGGMITDATWVDFDGDRKLDLVTVGEWMPIQFLRNVGNRFEDVTSSTGLPSTRGWWSSVTTGDFDGDGRPDIVAGNLGLNYSYATSKDTTFEVYANNFTGNQTTDVVLAERINGTSYPLTGMAPLGRDVYTTAIKFPTFGTFAAATMDQLFGAQQLKQSLHYETDTFASVFIHNDGGDKFSMTKLPSAAQISPLKAIIARHMDEDGHLDLLVAGNMYEAEPNTTRADADNGLWLRGDGRGHFFPVSPAESGFLAPGDAAGLFVLHTQSGEAIVVSNVADSLQVFRVRHR